MQSPRLLFALLAGLLLAGPCWGASIMNRAEDISVGISRAGQRIGKRLTQKLNKIQLGKIHATQAGEDMFDDCPALRRLFVTASGACLPVTQNLTGGGNIISAAPLMCGTCSAAIISALETTSTKACSNYNWLPSLCDMNGNKTCLQSMLPAVRAIENAPLNPGQLLKNLSSILPWTALPGLCTPNCERTVSSLRYINAFRSYEVFSALCAPRNSTSACHSDTTLRNVLQNPATIMTDPNTFTTVCNNRCLRAAAMAIDPQQLNMLLDFACVKPNATIDCLTAVMAVNSTTLSDPAYCTAATNYLSGTSSCCTFVYLGLAGMPGMGNVTAIASRLVQCGVSSAAHPTECAKATRPAPLGYNLSIPFDWASGHAESLTAALLDDFRGAFSLSNSTTVDFSRDRTMDKNVANTIVMLYLLEDTEATTAALASAINQTVAAGALGLPQTELLFNNGEVKITLPFRPNVAPPASLSLDEAASSCQAGSGAMSSCSGFVNAIGSDPTIDKILGAGQQLCQAGCQNALRTAVQTGVRDKAHNPDCGGIAVLTGLCNATTNAVLPCASSVLQQLQSLENSDDDEIPFSSLAGVCTPCGLNMLKGIAQGVPEAQPMVVMCSRNRNNVTCLNDPTFQAMVGGIDHAFDDSVTGMDPGMLHAFCDNDCLRRLVGIADPTMADMMGKLCVKKGNTYCIEKLVPLLAAMGDDGTEEVTAAEKAAFCTNLTTFSTSDAGCCLGLLPVLTNTSAADLGAGLKAYCPAFQPAKIQPTACKGTQVAKRYIGLSMKWSSVASRTGEISNAIRTDVATSLGISPDTVSVVLGPGSTSVGTAAHKFDVLAAEQGTIATVSIQASSDDTTSQVAQNLDRALADGTLSLAATSNTYAGAVNAAAAPAPPPPGRGAADAASAPAFAVAAAVLAAAVAIATVAL